MSEIFSAIVRPGLDGQIMDAGGDLVTVLRRQQHGNGHLADDFQHACAGAQIAGQDDAGHRLLLLVVESPSQAASTMSSRSPGVMSSTPALEEILGVVRAHRADHHVFHQAAQFPRLGSKLSASSSSRIDSRVGLDKIGRCGMTPSRSSPLRFSPRRANSVMISTFWPSTLFRMTPMISTPSFSNNAWFSATSSMGLPMPPWRHDDDLGAENLRHLGVGQIEHRPDARVAGAFAQHKILFPRDAVEGFLDFFHQRLVVGGLADICA